MLVDGDRTYPIHYASWNLLGCAGAQMDDDYSGCKYAVSLLLRILLLPPLIIGFIAVFIAFLPFELIVFGVGRALDASWTKPSMRFIYACVQFYGWVFGILIGGPIALATFPLWLPILIIVKCCCD